MCEVVIENVGREYPNQVVHLAFGDAELRPPRERHPVFCGCFDWHSAVHSHWALLRLWRHAVLKNRIEEVVERRVTPEAIAAEVAYLGPRARFELPYGLAWLLCLCGEASRCGQFGGAMRNRLAPMEQIARDRIVRWARGLSAPVRAGEHANSAFAMTLAIDWARIVGDAEVVEVIGATARALHEGERDVPWAWEPSAYDFVSPALSTAWLMSRVMDDGFARWLDAYAPTLGRGLHLEPPVAADKVDGKLVHWDGLALSRAWMLVEIAAALPARDARVAPLTAQADAHGQRGLAALDDATYAGTHWLPTFALYWLGARAQIDRAM